MDYNTLVLIIVFLSGINLGVILEVFLGRMRARQGITEMEFIPPELPKKNVPPFFAEPESPYEAFDKADSVDDFIKRSK